MKNNHFFLLGNIFILFLIFILFKNNFYIRITTSVILMFFGIMFTGFFSSLIISNLKTKYIKLINASYLILFTSILFLSIKKITKRLSTKKTGLSEVNDYLQFKENLKFDIQKLIPTKSLNIKTNNFLNYQISFFKYSALQFLLNEIFFKNTYYFKTKNKNPFIIDCGSNIGISVLYFKKLYPNSNILCFEPDKATFQLLKKNIQQNNLANAIAINKALSKNNDYIEFYIESNNPGSLKMSGLKERIETNKQINLVKATPLSKFINQKVDLIKMDIEGSETEVIQELYNNNKLKLVDNIIIEYHHNLSPKNNLAQILEILKKSNFNYQLSANFETPFMKNKTQDIMIFAYKKI